MELKDQPFFDTPRMALDDYSPGMSPYIHRWLEMNDRPRRQTPQDEPLSDQVEEALRRLIDSALGKGESESEAGR